MAISGPVQEVIGSTTVPAASYAVTIAAASAGNSLLLCGESSTSSIQSVSGGGVTWAKAVSAIGTGVASEIWFGHNSSGVGTTITVNYASKANGVGSCNITEWSGLNNAVADATNSATGLAGTAPTAGAVTSVFAASLLIASGAWATDDYSSGPTNSFTRGTSYNDAVNFAEAASKIVAVTGSYSTAWVLTAGANWASAIAAFGAPAPVTRAATIMTMGVGST